MKPEDFDYPLPKELVSQKPLANRDASRLLVTHRQGARLEDKQFTDIVGLIPKGDALVLNDTKVFPAKILGRKKRTDGKVDILLLEPYEKSLSTSDETISAGEAEEMKSKVVWRCLVQPVLKEGQEIIFDGEKAEAVFWKRDLDSIPLVEFKNCEDVKTFAQKIGSMPLPPYIKREADSTDAVTYQTVFAQNEGAVAAPTAGLHFTDNLLNRLKEKGVEIVSLTLHVGYGTFKPVEDIAHHKIHSEAFEFSPKAAETLNRIRSQKGKIWAVGTTSLRVLETCVQKKKFISGIGRTDLFVKPGFEFEAVDHLITNFHMPKTTLLLLVSAFMGEKLRKTAYEHAIQQKYRFYSYGDAMVIL